MTAFTYGWDSRVKYKVIHPVSRLAVFDVCDTLYSENTTLGFLKFVHGTSRRFKCLEQAVNSRRSPLFYPLAALYRFAGVDVTRAVLLSTLAGRTQDELEMAAAAYCRERLARLKVKNIHECLRAHLAAGDQVVLLSNSLDVVVGAIAAHLNVEWRATELVFDAKRFTGRSRPDMSGRKSLVAQNLLAQTGPNTSLYVYTDNTSDRDLVDIADEAVVVLPAGRKRSEWKGAVAQFVVPE